MLPMPKHLSRKRFLQLSILTNIGLLAKPLQFFGNVSINTKIPNSQNVVYYTAADTTVYNTLRQGFNKRN